VNAEFIVWALVVGLVLGAGLVWLVIMDSRRRELDVEAVERPLEAAWLSAVMAEDGYDVSPEAAERLLDLHRDYLEAPPPDQAGWRRDGYDDGLGAATDQLAVDAMPVDEHADPPPVGEP
jgi:hypothetical protein